MNATPLVCVVDDTADYRFLVQFLFKRHFPHYSLALFPNGENFLDQLPGLGLLPSLILLDRHMPVLNGHQTLLAVKQHPVYKKIPVIMMSAGADSTEIDGCYEAGVNSFLRKPMDFDQLKGQLEIICQYWLELNRQPVEMV